MDRIYDELLKKGKIQPLAPKRPEEVGRVHDPKYCRYHQIVGHPTNACGTLSNAIQDLVDSQVLAFKEEGSLHEVDTVYLTSEEGVPYHTADMCLEVPRPRHFTCKHCHVTCAQIIEPENALGKEVHQTRSGKDFAKDYLKSTVAQIGQPQDDEEVVASQKEDFRHDIIDHLSRVPAKVPLLDPIKMGKSIRMSLLEALTEWKHESERASLSCLAIRRKESIPITFDPEDMLLGDCKHDRPLYSMGYIQEANVSRIQIDPGPAVNILPIQTMNSVGLTPRSLKETNVRIH